MSPSGQRNRNSGGRRPSSSSDPARLLAFDGLRAVHADDAYANLVLADLLRERQLSPRDAAFATELFAGTCRMQGSYDTIIETASDRTLNSLQPAVIDLLRLGTHQALSMRVADHAAVGATVDLAAQTVGRRVTGLINAILRKITAHDYDGWVRRITDGWDERDALALRTAHPRWIVDAYAELLPNDELLPALLADNVQPRTTLAVRPGLAEVSELIAAGAEQGHYSPYAAIWTGDPGKASAVADGRAGVQDEGSQLVALALARAETGDATAARAGTEQDRTDRQVPAQEAWLDLCAGPGGKAALLAGLAAQRGEQFLAAEIAPHRARLVARALSGYAALAADSRQTPQVIVADGTRPAWPGDRFGRVVADVPCTGLGALRRRPESRWRRTADAVEELHPLQCALLTTAVESTRPGGVIAYLTCSPHRRETVGVVDEVLAGRSDIEVLNASALLPEVDNAAVGPYLQLWPHRHGTDAMFAALLRRR